MSGIHIGVNALYLIPGGVGGTEIYLRNLLNALARIDAEDEFLIFTNRETAGSLTPAASNFQTVPQPVTASNRPARIFWEQIRLPGAARRERVDVLFNPGFTVPARCGCPSVTVFHDLQHRRHPEHFRWFDLPFWKLFLRQSIHSSDVLIAVSEATRSDLVHYYPNVAGKVRVVLHGVEERFFSIAERRRETTPEPYLLCVSTLHPHKNLERLIRAFSRFHRERPEFQLVLAGMKGFRARAIENLIDGLGLSDAVRLTGWLSRERLSDLYLRARAFVYPSTFEGFGLPVLEALASGIPTACASIPPLREVAGDAALLFDPFDEEALLNAVWRIVSDEELRERLSRAGEERARGFSWERTASETLEILRETAR